MRAGAGTVDGRLAQRFGVPLLSGGYTALPTLAYQYYARLDVSEAEFVFIGQLCTYWWSTRDPYPGEEALAARMGKSKRTIQGYIRSLAGKGLLHIHTRHSPTGQQHSNAYDLRPFFQAIAGLARLDGRLADTGAGETAATRHATAPQERARRTTALGDNEACSVGPRCHKDTTSEIGARQSLCAGTAESECDGGLEEGGWSVTAEGEERHTEGVQEFSPQVDPVETDPFDSDAIPPTPIGTPQRPVTPDVLPATATASWKESHASHRAITEQDAMLDTTPCCPGSRSPAALVHGDHCDARPPVVTSDHSAAQGTPVVTLVATIRALSDELGDDAPTSSGTRASNLYQHAGVPLDQFLRLVDEAAARTRARQATIVKRRRDGQVTNGMPYLFAVLQDLLQPAPRHSDTPDLERGRRERPGRPRRRPREEPPRTAWVGWTDTPVRRPITENNPVWRAVLDELALVLTVENFNAWLASTRVVGQEGELLRIAVPEHFNKDWLEVKLQGRVRSTLGRLGYGSWQVEYVVAAATGAVRTADVMVS